MIKLELNVRDALYIADRCPDLYEKIVTALEVALGINQRCVVTITGGMTLDNRIPCIKAIRLNAGWGLKEAKDWTDTLVGGWKYDKFVPAATNAKQSITLKTPEAAENLLRDLAALGCEGYLS
jgi:ribosomal protein L7/L12